MCTRAPRGAFVFRNPFSFYPVSRSDSSAFAFAMCSLCVFVCGGNAIMDRINIEAKSTARARIACTTSVRVCVCIIPCRYLINLIMPFWHVLMCVRLCTRAARLWIEYPFVNRRTHAFVNSKLLIRELRLNKNQAKQIYYTVLAGAETDAGWVRLPSGHGTEVTHSRTVWSSAFISLRISWLCI